MRFDVLTLFPDIFLGYLGQSLLHKAIQRGLVSKRGSWRRSSMGVVAVRARVRTIGGAGCIGSHICARLGTGTAVEHTHRQLPSFPTSGFSGTTRHFSAG